MKKNVNNEEKSEKYKDKYERYIWRESKVISYKISYKIKTIIFLRVTNVY